MNSLRKMGTVVQNSDCPEIQRVYDLAALTMIHFRIGSGAKKTDHRNRFQLTGC